MATIATDKSEVDIADDESIIPACEKLGVPFACYEGVCGVCKIKILEGADNLGDKTDAEKAWGLGDGERLACQCKIKTGKVKISW